MSSSKYVTNIHECIEGIDTSRWAPKNIIRVEDLNLGAIKDTHVMPVRGGTFTAETDALRFNHYNVNPAQLEWMKGFYRTTAEFKINARDEGMERYQKRLHDQCKL